MESWRGGPGVHREPGGPSLPTLPFYQEEAGRLFVLDPRILSAYLAFAPFLTAA